MAQGELLQGDLIMLASMHRSESKSLVPVLVKQSCLDKNEIEE